MDNGSKLVWNDSETASITIFSTGQFDRTKSYVVHVEIDTQVTMSEKATLTR